MLYGTKVLGPVLKKHKYAYSTKSTWSGFRFVLFSRGGCKMDAGPDPPARRPLPKRPRLDRPRLNLLAWLHSTLEPKRRLRLPEGEVSAFVTSIADRLLAGALDDGSSVTGRSLKKFFTRAGPEASLDFLRTRHITDDVAVWCSLDGEQWQSASQRPHPEAAATQNGISAVTADSDSDSASFEMTDNSHTMYIEVWDHTLKTRFLTFEQDIMGLLEVCFECASVYVIHVRMYV